MQQIKVLINQYSKEAEKWQKTHDSSDFLPREIHHEKRIIVARIHTYNQVIGDLEHYLASRPKKNLYRRFMDGVWQAFKDSIKITIVLFVGLCIALLILTLFAI